MATMSYNCFINCKHSPFDITVYMLELSMYIYRDHHVALQHHHHRPRTTSNPPPILPLPLDTQDTWTTRLNLFIHRHVTPKTGFPAIDYITPAPTPSPSDEEPLIPSRDILLTYRTAYSTYLHHQFTTASTNEQHRRTNTYFSWAPEPGYIIQTDLTTSPPLTPLAKLSLLRFRTINHDLPIETLSWTTTPRQDRHCPECTPATIACEHHALFHCTRHDALRTQYPKLPFASHSPLDLFSKPVEFSDFIIKLSRCYSTRPLPPTRPQAP